jgi:FKBP-type peptidyl-prolyl cis-trans isomerase FkpA
LQVKSGIDQNAGRRVFAGLPTHSKHPIFQEKIFMTTTTSSGLQFEDTVLGTGAIAKAGQNVKVHYTGWLYNNGMQGAKFDSSKDRGQPFEFSLGAGQVIKGWDEGVQGMSVGGTRRLVRDPAERDAAVRSRFPGLMLWLVPGRAGSFGNRGLRDEVQGARSAATGMYSGT